MVWNTVCCPFMSVLYMAYYVKKVTTASVSISVNDLQTSILEDHVLVYVLKF